MMMFSNVSAASVALSRRFMPCSRIFHQESRLTTRFYRQVMLAEEGPLGRAEREYLAVCVSEANACPYCVRHHRAALDRYQPEALSEQCRELLRRLAEEISATPWKSARLRESFFAAGYSDAQWQHAVMVAGYFNMANRLVLAMGVELEPDYLASCR